MTIWMVWRFHQNCFIKLFLFSWSTTGITRYLLSKCKWNVEGCFKHLAWQFKKMAFYVKCAPCLGCSPNKYIIIAKLKVKILWFHVYDKLHMQTYLSMSLCVHMWLHAPQGTVFSRLTKLLISALFHAFNMFSIIEYLATVLWSESSPH